jgi:hypothetical protein
MGPIGRRPNANSPLVFVVIFNSDALTVMSDDHDARAIANLPRLIAHTDEERTWFADMWCWRAEGWKS